MTGSDRLRMKKTPKNMKLIHEKRGNPFTDQTDGDGGGHGFTHKAFESGKSLQL